MKHSFFEIFSNYYEFSFVIIRIIVALLVNYLLFIYYKVFRKKLQRTDSFFSLAALQAIYPPVIFYIWLATFANILKNSFFGLFMPVDLIVPYIIKFSAAKNIVLMWWSCMRFVSNLELLILKEKIKSRFYSNFSTVQALAKFLKTIFVIILVLSILPIFQVSISGILAFGGGSAVVTAFAAKDILANYLAGFVIHTDGNLKVGDIIFIETRDLKAEGHIEIIGWRTLTIKTLDQKTLFIPNSTIISIPVANVFPKSNFRIEEQFIVDHKSKEQLSNFISDLNKMLKNQVFLAEELSNLVYLKKIIGNGFVVELVAHTTMLEKNEYRVCLETIMMEISYIIDKLGIKLYREDEDKN